jgi:hypothetical protein
MCMYVCMCIYTLCTANVSFRTQVCIKPPLSILQLYIKSPLSPFAHTYTHTYTYILIHIHIHKHTHAYTYIHIHTHIHTHTYTYIHIHTHTHTHTHTYIHIHTYTYIHIHKHTHTYTYTHTQRSLLFRLSGTYVEAVKETMLSRALKRQPGVYMVYVCVYDSMTV